MLFRSVTKGTQYIPGHGGGFFGGLFSGISDLASSLGPIGNIALAAVTGGLSLPEQIAAQTGLNLVKGQDLGSALTSGALATATGQGIGALTGGAGPSFSDTGIDMSGGSAGQSVATTVPSDGGITNLPPASPVATSGGITDLTGTTTPCGTDVQTGVNPNVPASGGVDTTVFASPAAPTAPACRYPWFPPG